MAAVVQIVQCQAYVTSLTITRVKMASKPVKFLTKASTDKKADFEKSLLFL